jgi:putative CocE/NonD family hydrolase
VSRIRDAVAGSLLAGYADLLGRSMKLPGAAPEGVRVERDLTVQMDDGVSLLADLYRPRRAGPMPTVLVRTPYGRAGPYGLLYGLVYAQRGLQVLVQSTRGTFGSEGEFEPFNERADGLATLGWIQRQPWHDGKIGMAGASYLGLVQWAVAGAAGPELGAISPTVTASQFHGASYDGGLALESVASWHMMVAVQEQPLAALRMLVRLLKLRTSYDHLPLGELDAAVLGRESELFRHALEHTGSDSAFWLARDHTATLANVEAPALLIAGWHDLFTPWQLGDYVALRRAGRDVRLLVGPWTHTSPTLWAVSTRESIRWLRRHLLDDRRMTSPARVRVHVGGTGEWRELRDWPPPRGREWRLWLQPGNALGRRVPEPSAPDSYRYDPAEPTPAYGGPVLLAHQPVVDNRRLEARHDVLVYTTPRLPSGVDAIGPVQAEIFVRSSLPHFDVFVRVCDVDRFGVSRNVCDALTRVEPHRFPSDSDGITRVSLSLWPTAHRFRRDHRIRLQVSSGAHPRYARNPGTGEPLATATRLVPADQEIFHDPAHPSSVSLTVLGSTPNDAWEPGCEA